MKIKVFSDGFEGYTKRSLDRAKKLSKGVQIKPEMSITFDDPLKMAEVLTAERIRLCRITRTGSYSVSDLAKKLSRDVKAVRRDVEKLEQFGLLKTHFAANPGHGKVRIVEPAAQRFELTASV